MKRVCNRKFKFIFAGTISLIAIFFLIYFSVTKYFLADNMLTAKNYLKTGKVKSATILLQEVIKQDSSNVEAYKLLAKIYREKGNYFEAARIWVSVEKLDPFDADALKMQASNLLSMRAYPAVIDLLIPFETKKNNIAIKIYLAKAYIGTGKIIKAENIINKLLKNNSKNQHALLLKGNIEFYRKRIVLSKRTYNRIDSPDIGLETSKLIGLGNCYDFEGEKLKAEDYYIQANTLSNKSYQTELILSDFYSKNRKYSKSIKILSSLYNRYPASIELITSLADIYALTNNIQAIQSLQNNIEGKGILYIKVKYYLKALSAFLENNYSEAIQLFDWAGKRFQKGRIYSLCILYSNAKMKKTIRVIKTMNEFLNPNTPSKDNSEIVKFLLSESEQALKNKNYTFTLNVCKQISQYDFQNIQAHLLLMWSYFLEKRLNESQIEATIVLSKDKYNLNALEVRGRIKLNKGDYKSALSDFNMITEKYPELPTGYYWEGITLMKQQQFSKSLSKLETAQKLRPDNIQIINAIHDLCLLSNNSETLKTLVNNLIKSKTKKLKSLGYAFSAETAVKNNQLKNAVEYYKKAILNSSNYIPYYLHLSKTLSKLKEYQKAQLVLLDSLKIDPNNRYALFELAHSYYENGEINKSINIYERLLEIYPDWVLPLVNYSMILTEQNKDNLTALKYAKKAVQLSPNIWFTRQNLGEICLKRRNYKKAIHEFKETLKLKPYNKATLSYLKKAEKLNIKSEK